MKLPDPEQFNFKDVTIAGDECLLITPNSIKCKWDDDNSHFRSIIITKDDNKIVSLGMKKFCNWGEKPDFQPWNTEWKFDAYTKIDGSLLIISKYKGNLICRTRGTVDARMLANGHEIDGLIEKYPMVFDNPYLDSENWSIHCEWTTPNNIIVIREHEEPTLTLLGLIRHDNQKYLNQKAVDGIAKNYNIGRPKRHHYNSVKECIDDVTLWRGIEGVVIYSIESDIGASSNQTLKKIKASLYCELHKIATGMRTISNVLDVFMESPRFVEYQDFYKFLCDSLDFEIAERVKDDIAKITEAYGKFIHSINTIERAMEYISKLDSRKKQAMAIQEHWDGWMIPVGFSLLDNKELDDKLVKKSMEKILNL